MRRSYYNTLADARAFAQVYADEDNASWCIWKMDHFESLEIQGEWEAKPYGKKLLETVKPGLITIKLTPEEAAHYQEYIETERLTRSDGFEGGMYETPVEKSILAKIKAAFAS